MAYYNVCSKCGATLDPGESCDCGDQEEAQQRFPYQVRESPGTGQYSFFWDGKDSPYGAGNAG